MEASARAFVEVGRAGGAREGGREVLETCPFCGRPTRIRMRCAHLDSVRVVCDCDVAEQARSYVRVLLMCKDDEPTVAFVECDGAAEAGRMAGVLAGAIPANFRAWPQVGARAACMSAAWVYDGLASGELRLGRGLRAGERRGEVALMKPLGGF